MISGQQQKDWSKQRITSMVKFEGDEQIIAWGNITIWGRPLMTSHHFEQF